MKSVNDLLDEADGTSSMSDASKDKDETKQSTTTDNDNAT